MALALTIAFVSSIASAQGTTSKVATLTAAQIVEKNVAARGGLEAWRAVQSISTTGKMGVGGNQRATLPVPQQRDQAKAIVDTRPKDEVQLPFAMYMQRPLKSRFELKLKNETAVQVFDGTHGWKLRPYLNRSDAEPFTPDELKLASTQGELDGPLVDYAAKDTQVELDGIESVEGQDTYKLKLSLKDGRQLHVWIDARTFLEVKIEGQPRRLDGRLHPVEVYYRDYRKVSGLEIPFLLETRVLPFTSTVKGFKDTPVPPEKIIIDSVVVNPKLDASLFMKPEVVTASNR